MATYSQCRNIEIDPSELLAPSAGTPDFIKQESRDFAPKYVEQVTALLERIRGTWTGWSVLCAICSLSNKKMVIMPWNKYDKVTLGFEQNATAGPKDMSSATPRDKTLLQCGGPNQANPMYGDGGSIYKGTGKGSDTEIRFTPDMWTGTGTAPTGPGSEASEILFHEMIHGLRQMRGVMQCGATTDNPKFDTREEFMAILISNMYRSELRRPGMRADHHGFTKLPVPLEDATAFCFKFTDYIQQLVEQDRGLAMRLKNVNCTFNPVKVFYDRYPAIFSGAAG